MFQSMSNEDPTRIKDSHIVFFYERGDQLNQHCNNTSNILQCLLVLCCVFIVVPNIRQQFPQGSRMGTR